MNDMKEMTQKSKELVRKLVDNLIITQENYDIYDIINDLKGFIERFDVKVFYSNMEGFVIPSQISGYSIVNKQRKPEIVINANDSIQRQRFTMARELGHIIMHWNWLANKEQGLTEGSFKVTFRKIELGTIITNIQEVQANEFAAELLLPHQLIMNIIGDIQSIKANPILFETIKQRISEAFNVSKTFAHAQLLRIIQGDFD